MDTDTLADIRARITALRAMRELARQHGDEAKADELTHEIEGLTTRLLQMYNAQFQAQEAN